MNKKRILSFFLILSFLIPSFQTSAIAQPSDAPNFAPIASVSITAPDQVLIGETFSFSVTFDNTSAVDVGYGPYINVFLPQSGADDSNASEKEDGIIYTSVDYLGNEIRTWDPTCTANSTLIHPLTSLAVTCPSAPAGTVEPFTWQLLVVELPFGSFAPDQPAAAVSIDAQLSDYADLNLDLPIYAESGYRFGADAIDNPSTDPAILGLRVSTNITPSLLILEKIYNWREDETSTGPNFPRQYTLSVNIPENQTITNLVVSDILPENMQFIQVESTAPAVTGCTYPSTSTPGGTLSCNFASVTGTDSPSDATITFSFYIPLADSTGARVISPTAGGCVTSDNPVSAAADWDPLDPRDSNTLVQASENPAHILEDCSHTIQKFHSIVDDKLPASYSPGDVVEYQLEFQVSDYFAEDAFTVWDTVSDGQRFDPTFAPTLSIEGNLFALVEGNFNSANYTVLPDYSPADTLPNTGDTNITFYISNEIVTRGQSNGRLIGGCVPTNGTGGSDPNCGNYNDGPTTGIIRFRTIIQEEFSDAFPSGDRSVDQGDLLNNDVIATGIVLNNSDLSSTGNIASESSAASFVISYGILSKSIYAVNGNTSISDPVRLTANDTITYRITYSLNTSDVEDLSITDYLPLPVLDADEITVFDDVISSALPPAGHIKFGESDTFRNYSMIVPILTVDSLNNSFTIFYGDFDSTSNLSTIIDLLFTVTVSDDPFADGLYLTNQVIVKEGSTNHEKSNETKIVQFILDEPYLKITKGAVSSNRANEVFIPAPPAPVSFSDPGGGCPRFTPEITSSVILADPITSDISQVDAGDQVTFALIIENIGHESAYDVVIRDTLPAGYAVPAGGLNLCVANGNGTALAYSDLAGGLLGSGIALDDSTGAAIKAGLDGSDNLNAIGDNIAVITFDLELTDIVESTGVITNSAFLTNYSGTEGGGDFTAEDPSDSANTIIRSPISAKTLFTTNQDHTSGANVAIGEIASFDLTVTIPEGLTAIAVLTDDLPIGLAFVDCVSITPSSDDLSTDLPGGFAAACNDPANPTVVSDGDLVQFTLGNLTNSNRNNEVAETLLIRFSAVALNILSNQQGTSLINSAVFTWDGGTQTSSPAVLTVVEPAISVSKVASPVIGDAGDLITFDITITNPPGSVGAFNLSFDDIVPAELTYTSGSLQFISGLSPDTIAETPDLNAYWASFPSSSTSLLRFTGTLKTSVTPGDRVTNDAIVKFTSLPGEPGQQSSYSPVSYERSGKQSDPGGTANDYTVTDPAFVDVTIPTPIKYLVATSEVHTSGTDVSIGEIVRYRLASILPEGSSAAFQFRELLPNGLLYLDDGTTRLAFISNGLGITSSTITCTNDNGASGDPTVILTNLIDCTFPAGGITNSGTANPYAPGSDPWLNFGNLANTDNDVDQEYVIVEFNALVVNAIGNQSGTSLANDFRVYEGNSQVADANNLSVRVVEPTLTVNKTVSSGPYDAGDLITYTVVLTAGSAATATDAFDIVFNDVVNAALQVQSHTIVVPVYATASDTSAGNSIDFTISRLNKGDSATITITALIPNDTLVFLTVPNTAGIVYTSLPGINGTTPNATGSNNTGIPGTQNGERTDQDGAGGLNDYTVQDAESITLSQPAVDKRDANPLVYTIGETVVFPILVNLPEGVTKDLEIIDDLPEGLEYVSSEVITSAAASGGLLLLDFSGSPLTPTTTTLGGSGDNVTWGFGDITTTADAGLPAPDNNRFLIRITARVMDIALNSGGDTLNNSVSLTFTNPNTGSPVTITDAPVTISLIEPVMSITKTFDPIQASINETVQVTLVVSNTGTSPAHDVIIEDPFPSALFQSAAEFTKPADFVYEAITSGGNHTVRYSGGPIEAGGSRTFVFNVTTNSGFVSGTSFNNIASVTQATTLPGESGFERDEPEVSANDDLNGISPDLVLIKDDGTTTITAGDTLIYTLTIENVGLHDAVNLIVSDTVPEGAVFDLAGSTLGWSCEDSIPAGTLCTFNIPTLASLAQTSVYFAVRINDPLEGSISQIENNASVADDGTYGPDPTPANNTDDDIDTLADTAPDISIIKVDTLKIDANDNDMPSAGDTIQYTITITNNGNHGADSVIFEDTPDANSSLVTGSVVVSQGSITQGNTAGDTSVRINLGEIPGAGGTATIQFDVLINDPLPDDIAFIENQGLVSGINNVDEVSDDPDYPDIDEPTLTLLDTALLKVLADTDQNFTDSTNVAIGEIVIYEVTIKVPPGETRSATLSDTLDRGLAFVNCDSITAESGDLITDLPEDFGAACENPVVSDEPSGSIEAVDQGRAINFNLGNLTNSSENYIPLTLRYRVVVLNVQENQDGISLRNQVTWSYEGGELSTSAEAVTVVEPDMLVIKSSNRNTAANGTIVTFSLKVSHTADTNADAHDVIMTDILPANLIYQTGTFIQISGPSAILDDSDPANLRASWIVYPSDAVESVFEFQARVNGLSAGESTRNEVDLSWSSLPGDETLPRSGFNNLSNERFFDPPSDVDDYGANDSLAIRAPTPTSDSDPTSPADPTNVPTPRPIPTLPATK